MSALYRKHRPRDFDEFSPGQPHVVQTLRNAIEMDRVAHAYLFAGPRGTGKTSMAKILAKSLNCEHGPTTTPCKECESCRSIHEATSIDVIELDAASHRGIDDIREIRDRVALQPVRGRRKVYIIDEAHMLTKEASNAVLKTLEEPPPHAVFVLCTTEMAAMLPTIRSRCQRFAFARPGLPEISTVLHRIARAESIEIEPAAVTMIARAAGGSFRDAVSALDQLATACPDAITVAAVRDLLGTTDSEVLLRTIDLVADGDAADCLRLVDEQADAGTDLGMLVTDLLGHLRFVFLNQQLGELPADVPLTEDERARIGAQSGRISPGAVHRLVDMLRDVLEQVREGADPRLPLELALVRACRPAADLSLDALNQRVSALEARAGGGAPTPAPAPPPQPAPAPGPTAAATAPPSDPAAGAAAPLAPDGRGDHARPGAAHGQLERRDRAGDRPPVGPAAVAHAVREPTRAGRRRGRARPSPARTSSPSPPPTRRPTARCWRRCSARPSAAPSGCGSRSRPPAPSRKPPAAEQEAEPIDENDLLTELKEKFDAREIEERR